MLVGAAPANAAPPNVTISASATAGAAPLTVTFQASGDAASYHWQLGNGETADGPTAGATYVAGLWTATVTATAADGETTQASVTVRSVAVTLLPAAASRYGRAATFQGKIVPALAGEPVALYVGGREVVEALADADGAFRFRLPRARTPGPYEARTPVAASAPVALGLHPLLRTTYVGARAVGGRLALAARVVPARAGTISIRLYRDGILVRKVRKVRDGAVARLHVPTDRIADYRAVVRVLPTKGWLGAVRVARAGVRCASDAPGSGDGLVYYGGSSQFQPLLSFAALNNLVLQRRCGAARRLASALLARGVRRGGAGFWGDNFALEGRPGPRGAGLAPGVGPPARPPAGGVVRGPGPPP